MTLDPWMSDEELQIIAEKRTRARLPEQRQTAQEIPDAILNTQTPRVAPNQKRSGAMNKTESQRSEELEAMRIAGQIQWFGYEAITLKLANDTRYTPDFAIVDAVGNLKFEETKGFWRDDAKVKIKVAARLFPHFHFSALKKRSKLDGGGWRIEEFAP